MSPKRKVLFIANPISGPGAKLKLPALITRHLDNQRFDWTIYKTKQRGDATERAQKAVQENFDLVVAVGGDGTINEVAQGLIFTTMPMGIIPNGSGNGLAKHLGISDHIPTAISQLNDSQTTPIDTGWFNDQLFLNVAGIGFDAQVAHAFDNHDRRGLLSYIWLSIREYLQFTPQATELIVDQLKVKTTPFIITIANGSQYGNNAFIAPHASLEDGLLNLTIVAPLNIARCLTFPYKLFTKSLSNSKHTQLMTAKKIVIHTSAAKAQIDGETIAAQATNTVEIKPKSLLIFAPKI
ncbi:lipid kinase, YegS/Rv2252/BmrU family [Reichenbachiella agariperforans]|uniref:Lipid kinase, YegS/Rv2252/BmrU family n=1 Tax=Reichenbachiella agariperforans TaxID=156994 RepID=A0A1M6RJG4_REIAG|nr:diacylglycerol kinase family protein [Reichenbachiella agariperforans]SHK32641.1 lipid kinase, YegS/Rv2252/BmrU family [Reichenbachiella agariperforans]